MDRKLQPTAINCKVERRMISKAPKAAVRLLLGSQMLLFGIFSLITEYQAIQFGSWSLARYEQLWDWMMLISALGLVVPCLIEMYYFRKIDRSGPGFQVPMVAKWLAKARTLGYVHAGCIWSALWYIGLFDGRISSMDFLGLLYVTFVVWLHVSDARMQRRVHSGYEKRRPFLAFY